MENVTNITPFTGQTRSNPSGTLGNDGSNSGGDGGDMESRVTRLETLTEVMVANLGEMKSDIKSLKMWLLGTAIGVIVGIAGLNWAIVQTTLAAIDTGRETAKAGQSQTPAIIINVPPTTPSSAVKPAK